MLELGGVIAESLAGQRIAVTGATGFVGTALVERLLRGVPDCTLVLLVRDGKRTPAAQRVRRELLRNDAFDRLRAQYAAGSDAPDESGESGESFDAMCARRITTISGDVSRDGLGLDAAGREQFAGCDIVIHSAAAVSFDSPLDAAVEINLLGPTRIADLINELAAERGAAYRRPHLVAVSTCYVAGNRRGEAPEELVSQGPFNLGIAWRDEVATARRLRGEVEARSRLPEQLTGFRTAAQRELGAAGPPALAAKTEQLRQRWVHQQRVEAGRARAASVGWPDAYAFTKALGEEALTEVKGDTPVSIVRPSIIESAWAEPHPGWIRGFRMAEPVILSYARGLLREFPGVPEGTIDVIPVDIVVAAIIAVAAAGPSGAPDIVHVASGGINPLHYRTLVDAVRNYFTANPLYDADGQPIVVPEWRFPGRGRVQAQLRRAKSALDLADRALLTLPLRGRRAEASARLEAKRDEIERALEYVELYGLYTECEAIYQVDNLLTLWNSLDAADQAAFNFDPRSVDWDHYANAIHLPAVVHHGRVKTTPTKSVGDRAARLRRQVLAPERQLAVFDLAHTLVDTNVVELGSWRAIRHLGTADRRRYLLRSLRDAPRLISELRADRADFLRAFYRRYEGMTEADVRADTDELLAELLMARAFPDGLDRVRAHRAAGHRTVLITGVLSFDAAGMAPLFDEVIAAEMSIRPDGTLSGELSSVPPSGEARAQLLAEYATSEGLALAETVAYADSTSDLAMLEAVGFPVAVNPDQRLAALARKRGWLVEHWERPKGSRSRLVDAIRAVSR